MAIERRSRWSVCKNIAQKATERLFLWYVPEIGDLSRLYGSICSAGAFPPITEQCSSRTTLYVGCSIHKCCHSCDECVAK
ncbi:unnamed protein product [Soboliphyme baturini]|uniref:ShKT domain-containing protein n=1 Tax=Soboliphyme baturini TaxID=241478 RepID=A0A183IUA9_9BILA|nr:unnamed protein product [Soboliphyme baturini]